jgi:hypothetical protein
MKASRFVLEDILRTIESGNIAEAEKIFGKFARRYHGDTKLSEAYEDYRKYLAEKKADTLNKVKKKLSELKAGRRCESSGELILPLSDRRNLPGSTQNRGDVS